MNIFNLLLTQPLANGLILFYKILGQNMGIAIIGFSLFLRTILNPLTKPYIESMKKMRDYSKDIEKIKARHKGDALKQRQAQAEFFKQKGINPSAGCLPYLIQIIVLIAFFRMFSQVLSPNGDMVARFNNLLYPALKFSENTQLNTHFLYLDITKPDVLKLPSLAFPLPGPIIILAAITQLLSAKLSVPYLETEKKLAKKTAGQSDDFQVAFQSSMIYTFPLLTIFAGMSFPSGLALYWFLFSLYQFYQQYRSTGWGGLTPWLKKLNLLKSQVK